MMTALDFVQSLQKMKKTRDQWLGLEFSDKSLAIKKISDLISQKENEIASSLAKASGMPIEFHLQHEVRPSLQTIDEVAAETPQAGWIPRPTGLISILLPEFLSFRVLAERLAPALLAGNGAFVFFPAQQSAQYEIWKTLVDEALPVVLLNGGEDLEQIMAAHPAIQAVSFYGNPERAQKIYQQVGSGHWKKWQITSGFHNSALILNDADLQVAAKNLAQSCFLGMGQLHTNISTIYVTESLRPQFEADFLEALEKFPKFSIPEVALKRHDQLLEQFRSEKGKFIFGGKAGEITLVEDLSHCSTLQQDCLLAPVVLISPVKYMHEMIKWANTNYYGLYAQIFGPDEKVQKFASQLDVSRVTGNTWMESLTRLPLGVKQSFFGNSSLDAFGDFFSDLRKIDGGQSKF